MLPLTLSPLNCCCCSRPAATNHQCTTNLRQCSCSVCDREMWNTNFYFEKDGLLFCKDDYWQKFGECCQECGEVVSGPIMIAGDHRFHPECFCCKICTSVIGDGDGYALIDRTNLFCGSCYRRQMPSSQVQQKYNSELASTTVTIIKKPPHSIRLVEIPWKSENKSSIRLSIDEDALSPPSNTSSTTRCRGVRISE
jgi:LIM domain kinase 1